jgi:hypothetical protein
VIAFTREALINDDVDFFERVPSFFANAAAAMESDIVYGILTGNPPLADGQPLFSTARNNLLPAAPITVQSINAARQAMVNQTAPDGQFLALLPRFLIVGPQQELSALQFLAPISIGGTTQNLIPRAYQSLQLIVEPRITDASWYLAADPTQVDTIEYDYHDGAPGGGPTLETIVKRRGAFRDALGARIQKRFRTRAEAVDAFKLLVPLSRQRRGRPVGVDPRITVGAWVHHWLRQTAPPALKPSAWEAHQRACTRHIVPRLGPVRLTELRRAQIRAFLLHVQAHGRDSCRRTGCRGVGADCAHAAAPLAPGSVRHV